MSTIHGLIKLPLLLEALLIVHNCGWIQPSLLLILPPISAFAIFVELQAAIRYDVVCGGVLMV